jgi:O-antigen ligase
MNLSDRANGIVTWCDRIMFGAFCGFIYFVPISIVLVEYSFGFAFLPYVVKRAVLLKERLKQSQCPPLFSFSFLKTFLNSFAPVASPLNRPIMIFVLINFLSVLTSTHPILSIKGFVFKLLESVFFYFVFLESVNSKKRIKIFFGFFMASAFLISINGVVQFFAGQGFIFNHLFEGRMSSTFRHPNDFGSYLIIVSILTLVLLLSKGCPRLLGYRRQETGPWPQHVLPVLLFAGLFILSVTCLGLTYSRGAWLGFFVGLLFLGIRDIKLLPVAGLVIFLFYIAFSPTLLEFRKSSLIYDNVRFSDVEKSGESSSAMEGSMGGSGRRMYWEEAVSIIKKFPLLGSGINTYSVVARDYKIAWGGYPHNCYLHMAAEIGLPGLLAFLWILLNLFVKTAGYLRRNASADLFLTAVLAGGFAGTGGFLVHSGVDTNFYSLQLGNFMWVIFGLLMAIQKIDHHGEYVPNQNS